MTAKFKVGKTSKEDYEKFLKKADEFCEMMRQSLDKRSGMRPGLTLSIRGFQLMMRC